jgi:RNA polymerase sigma-70 factor, ECF subfamily
MSICTTQERNESGIEGFQTLYEENFVSVYRFVYKNLRNREEAEDLTSQVFLKALRYLDPAQSDLSSRSWLFKIAHTTIADYWRTHYRASISSLDALLEVGWEEPIEEVILGTNELAAEQVYNLLEALPERYQEVLRCRFLFNLSIRETAATMRVSEANVKVLQYRALKFASKLENSITIL